MHRWHRILFAGFAGVLLAAAGCRIESRREPSGREVTIVPDLGIGHSDRSSRDHDTVGYPEPNRSEE